MRHRSSTPSDLPHAFLRSPINSGHRRTADTVPPAPPTALQRRRCLRSEDAPTRCPPLRRHRSRSCLRGAPPRGPAAHLRCRPWVEPRLRTRRRSASQEPGRRRRRHRGRLRGQHQIRRRSRPWRRSTAWPRQQHRRRRRRRRPEVRDGPGGQPTPPPPSARRWPRPGGATGRGTPGTETRLSGDSALGPGDLAVPYTRKNGAYSGPTEPAGRAAARFCSPQRRRLLQRPSRLAYHRHQPGAAL